ncbi:MAG: HAD-IC family P-type ATPase [Candidatus Moranbacteria bacterium]|nr:HAD-IC family P-type ATPase [Candidatus Moranbacteria bacterium]
MKNKQIWHNLSAQEAIALLQADPEKGLTQAEAKKRQAKYGKNTIGQDGGKPAWLIFFQQLTSPLIIVLFLASAVTLIMQKWTDSVVILAAVLLNSIFGFWEENKVSKILQKLKNNLKTKAVVKRDGQKKEILQEDLVPGDIILLHPGAKVPADGRVIRSQGLKISQANLTGEWIAEEKITKTMVKDTPVADRDNMVYMGCLVEGGEGQAVITETGIRTETGKVAELIKATEQDKTPLQKHLTKLGHFAGISIGVICALLFVGGVLRGEKALLMFETSVAVAVGGIPESLPVIVTVILAIGMERLLRRKGLVRNLSSVETLSSTSIICFDKTKTITQGKMELARVEAQDRELALKIASLSNEAIIENPEKPWQEWKLTGTPTDKALLLAGAAQGIIKTELKKQSKEVAKKRFDSYRKYQLSLRKEGNKMVLYIAGTPEKLIQKAKNSTGWRKKMEKLTQQGLRVVAVGVKKYQNTSADVVNLDSEVNNITMIGLVAFKDPIRPGITETVATAKSAGLKPVIITGDHRNTALAVGRKIGLEIEPDQVIEGKELDKLKQEKFNQVVQKIKIYARTEPRHKIKIVKAWQQAGHIVAMVGDGINDAPAIKKADIGLAQGSGTEIAKEASDLVLLTDSFEVIVSAIKEGRRILDNLRKSVAYVLADSLTSIIVVGGARIIFGWPLPILPVQLLWNNIIEDTLPTVAFAFEPAEKDIMKRKPNPKKLRFLTSEMKTLIFFTGLIDEFLILGLFYLSWQILGYDLQHARTLVFGAICVDTAFVIFSYKNLKKNLWQINPFSNKWLNLSAIFVIVAFAFSVYTPVLQKLLQTRALNLLDWAMVTAVCVASIVMIEITKWIYLKKGWM